MAEGPGVGAFIVGLATAELGREVVRRADDRGRDGALQDLCDAKVRQLRCRQRLALEEQDVGGLHVAMEDLRPRFQLENCL